MVRFCWRTARNSPLNNSARLTADEAVNYITVNNKSIMPQCVSVSFTGTAANVPKQTLPKSPGAAADLDFRASSLHRHCYVSKRLSPCVLIQFLNLESFPPRSTLLCGHVCFLLNTSVLFSFFPSFLDLTVSSKASPCHSLFIIIKLIHSKRSGCRCS